MRALRNVTLLENGSETGAAKPVERGSYHFNVTGTFGGTTATLQYRPAAARDWTTVASLAVLTAVGNVRVDLGEGEVRLLVAGGTPSGLYAYLRALS